MIEIIQLAEFPSYFPVDEPYPRLPPLSILFYIYSKGKGLVVPSGVVRTGQITDILVRDSKGPESGSSFMLLLCAREGIFLHGLAVLATGARAPWSSWFPRSKNGTWGTRHYQPLLQASKKIVLSSTEKAGSVLLNEGLLVTCRAFVPSAFITQISE